MSNRVTAWDKLTTHVCNSFGLLADDLTGTDRVSRGAWRAIGPGAPSKQTRFPVLFARAAAPMYLLASQRVTGLTVESVAKLLQVDELDAVVALIAAEHRLASDAEFAAQFEAFLEALDSKREQATNYTHAMTYEEIAAELGVCWQYVQQVEKRALAKLRDNPEAREMMEGLVG